MSNDGKGGSATRKIKWLGGIVVAVIALYSVGWLYLASRIDGAAAQAIANAEANGTAIGCANRDVRGYPFRLGLHCETTAIATSDGVGIEAGAFRSAAQVYEPNRIVSELDGPVRWSVPGASGTAEWDTARASTRFGTDGLRLGTFDLRDVTFEAAPEGAAEITGVLDRVLASIRPNGTELDAALNIEALDLAPIAGRDAPPATLTLDASVSDAAGALAGQPLESLRGRTVTLRSLGLALSGGGRVETSGTIDVDQNGLANGELKVGLSDPTATVTALSSLFPEATGLLQTIGGAFGGGTGGAGGLLAGFLGGGNQPETTAKTDPEAEPGELRTVTITLANGRARVGFIPLGNVPPLP